MTDRTGSQDRLAALVPPLKARGLETELTDEGLVVRNPNAPGCCPQQPGCCPHAPVAGATVACRPRAEDGGRWWFFTSSHEPICEADQVTDAVVQINGHLSGDRS